LTKQPNQAKAATKETSNNSKQLRRNREMVFSRLLRLSLALFASSTAVVVSAAGIYPDDHWSFATKLTTSNYAESIQSEIDNGKTIFVRFIASEVCNNDAVSIVFAC
jgi:hypothetical protein